ncbi:MAG TPA: hypothetical protein VH116_06370 [Gemmatimonadales bacterium]|jgi:hypothetical protein|nr:hypothetical protein [Gemmatimonadales bacterium]
MSAVEMPFLMRLGGRLAAAFAAGAGLLLVLAALGVGSFGIAGRPVTSGEWLRVAGPLFLSMGVLMAVIAYGFRARKRWSRHVVMVLWTTVAVYGVAVGVTGRVPAALAWRAALQALGLGALAAWYFYRNADVVGYFRSLG